MNWKAKWIYPQTSMGNVAPTYKYDFTAKNVKSATLTLTAIGVYDVFLNEKRVGDDVLNPGWTVYEKRQQYQTYDITDHLMENNHIEIMVANGWWRVREMYRDDDRQHILPSLIAEIALEFTDGTTNIIATDETWKCSPSHIQYSDIYNGELVDTTIDTSVLYNVAIEDKNTSQLIPHEGEKILEHERLAPVSLIKTPKGETVIDFGQNITGYIEFTVNAKKGELVKFSTAEVLDKEGNFYLDNYRTAKSAFEYICHDGTQTYKPRSTFYGFRYIRVDSFPSGNEPMDLIAIAVYSDIKQTGFITSESSLFNQFVSNVLWGQKDNFLEVPTDCPQRNERLGWTGDAQAFMKAACYNFDVLKFFKKWLNDMSAAQHENGLVPNVIPPVYPQVTNSAAWADAATICPWTLYETYGDISVLENQFDCMKKYIDYLGTVSHDEFLWTGGNHFGDWLALDAPMDDRGQSRVGAARLDLIASAFYAHSTNILVKTGEVLGKDMGEYKDLYSNIVKKFQKTFKNYSAQTEFILALHFNLAENKEETAKAFAEKMLEDGKLQTGFVGTPYLLHALSENGYYDLAYDLLLKTDYPSWLYPVTKGATTIWEHWDSIKEDGSFWPDYMNSFNHYAYGAVIDWVYEVAAGITPLKAGFAEVSIAPHPDKRLGSLDVVINTVSGKVRSFWQYREDFIRYEVEVPTPSVITIAGKTTNVNAGTHIFFEKANL